MVFLGRIAAAFGLMFVAAYLAVVALLPPPPAAGWRPDDVGGTSAASRLSQEAQALVSHKPVATLQ